MTIQHTSTTPSNNRIMKEILERACSELGCEYREFIQDLACYNPETREHYNIHNGGFFAQIVRDGEVVAYSLAAAATPDQNPETQWEQARGNLIIAVISKLVWYRREEEKKLQ